MILFAKIGGRRARKKLKGRSVLKRYAANIQFARETQKIISLFMLTEGMSFFDMSTIKKGRRLSAFVIPLGLEPRTHTLKVYCSTN